MKSIAAGPIRYVLIGVLALAFAARYYVELQQRYKNRAIAEFMSVYCENPFGITIQDADGMRLTLLEARLIDDCKKIESWIVTLEADEWRR